MGHMLWQAAVLILVVSLIDVAIRKWAWPQVRYALWLLVLIKLVIPPAWSMTSGVVPRIFPDAQQQLTQRISGGFRDGDEAKLSGESTLQPESGSTTADSPPIAASATAGPSHTRLGADSIKPVWQLYSLGVWILGMGLFVMLLTSRIKKLRRWHREQREKKTIPVWFHELLVRTAQRLKLERLPAIVFSDEVVTPAVYGVFHPVLLLPALYVDTLTREEAEHVLLHELAHLKRGDLVVHGFGLLLHLVYWFNPLMILVSKQIKHVREICCDLTIANLLREKTAQYRQTLLNTARALLTESVEPGMGLLGVFEEPYRLVVRLKWLEKNTWRNRTAMIATVCCVILIMVPLVLPMAAGQPKPENAGLFTMSSDKAELVPEESEPEKTSLGLGRKDVCNVEVTRVVSRVLGITTESKIINVSEMWIGDQRIALVEKNSSFICDFKNEIFYFVNHKESTYVETSLPIDPDEILSRELKWRYREGPVSGKVDVTDKTREFLGKECTRYDVVYWKNEGGNRTDVIDFKVWATTDVDFDYGLIEQFMENRRKIVNRDPVLCRELAKIKGAQMYMVFRVKKLGTSRTTNTRLVEIIEKEPPEHTYSPPPGYRQKSIIRGYEL
jgi:beta-lactamase regulating signal transducer with metallopeptidase domain